MAQQTATVSGNHNIVVQAQGNGIVVNINQPYLTLIAWHQRPAKVKKVLDLLNPFERAIPVVGMESVRNELQNWLEDTAPISVRCAVGGAGAGKTRLSIQLCSVAEDMGWYAGFITEPELSRFSDQQNLGSWRWGKDTLIVVDYAATKARILRKWLTELALNRGDEGRRLRLLLLERNADRSTGWWHHLFSPGGMSEEPLAELFDRLDPLQIPLLKGNEIKRTLLTSVMAEISMLDGRPSISLPSPNVDPEFDRKLGEMRLSTPLDLIMAGVTAVQEGIPALFTRGQSEMALRLARAELDRLARIGNDRGVNTNLMRFLGAGITLMGGCPRGKLRELVVEEENALGTKASDALEAQGALESALGSYDSRLLPVLPDLIGEAVIITQLGTLPDSDQAEFIARWFDRSSYSVAETLVRATQDYLADETPLGWLQGIADRAEDTGVLATLSAALPQSSVRLQKVSIDVRQRLSDQLGEGGRGHTLAHSVAVLVAAGQAAVTFANAGRHQDAYEQFRKAIQIQRLSMFLSPDEMAGLANPSIAQKLASLLDGASNELGALGRHQEAYETIKEAIDLNRTLVQHHPSHFEFQLGISLNNLAVILQDMGRLEEACDSSTEAIRLFRACAARGVDLENSLAMTLNNLGNQLALVGRAEEALEPSREAVRLYRELAAARPDFFRVGLAMALHNLSQRYRSDRVREAVTAAKEARDLYAELAKEQAETFESELANAHRHLADLLAKGGQITEALESAQLALTLYRRLVDLDPQTIRPKLAESLDTTGDIQRFVGELSDARPLLSEAVEIYRELASAQPKVFGMRYGESSARLGTWLVHLEDYYRARKCFVDAADEFRRQIELEPKKARRLLGYTLCFVAASLFDASLNEQAFEASEEAIEQIGPEFLADPKSLCKKINLILYSYAGLMSCSSRDSRPEVSSLANNIALKLTESCTEAMPFALTQVYLGYAGPQPLPPPATNRAIRILLAYHEGRVRSA